MTRERRRINELKVELAQVKQKLAEVERDREHYRVWFIAKLKWFIQLRGSGERCADYSGRLVCISSIEEDGEEK